MTPLYGYTFIKPEIHVRFIPPPPPTVLERLRAVWHEHIVPPLLFATSFTAFAVAVGLVR